MLENLRQKSYFYKLLLLCAAIIWGSSFVVFKNALGHLPPAIILTFRFFIAFCAVFFICRLKHKKIDSNAIIGGVVIGMAMALSYYFQNLGLKTTTPGKNAFFTSAYCIIVPFLFWITAKKRPDIYNLVAAVLLVAGVGLVYLGDAKNFGAGDVLTLFSTIFIALQIVFAAILLKRGDAYAITCVQFATGTVISIIIHLIFEEKVTFSTVPSAAYFQIIYLGIFATFVTLLFQNLGQKHVAPAQASIILSLEAVFGVIFSVIFFSERPTVLMFVGFSIIFLSLIVSETKPKVIFKRPK